MDASRMDWQSQSVAGLTRLTAEVIPGMEIAYLDRLAAHLLGPDAPTPPYTIEHGTAVASMLLRAAADAPAVRVDVQPDGRDAACAPARRAVVEGAHRFAARGGHGVHQLVTRFLAAAVGEMEQHKEAPEAQVRSLFYYGLLAIASGPKNQASAETAEGLIAAFHVWDERIGGGFVPPWRLATSDEN